MRRSSEREVRVGGQERVGGGVGGSVGAMAYLGMVWVAERAEWWGWVGVGGEGMVDGFWGRVKV